MPSWAEILAEINETAAERGPLGPDFDGVRQKYLAELHALTGRAVISYASGWLNGKGGFQETAVTGEDVHGFMQVCHGVEERELDLIIHSPGGDPQAAEQIVEYLRTQFDSIRCFVPLQAKSAATMIALGCDEIFMGHHSELGPSTRRSSLRRRMAFALARHTASSATSSERNARHRRTSTCSLPGRRSFGHTSAG